MWQTIADYINRLLTLKQQTEKNAADTEDLQEEVKELAAAFREMAYVVQRNRENEAHEREKLTLRLENILLRSGRELPPGDLEDAVSKDELRQQIEVLKRENEQLRKRLEQLEAEKE